ncbi:MAG: M28 family peptidase [Chloroflexi bacterium]|nr:M28 family peptidase [Chloroflexota bacterium]MDA1003166.1 M28 family peptidase [Chloroflexota bacterium]
MRVHRGLTLAAAGLVAAFVVACNGDDTPAGTATVAVPTASATTATPRTAPAAGATTTAATAATATPQPRRSDGTPVGIALAFDEARAMADVRELARPEYMGRHAGTTGELLGAQYLADIFAAAGLLPGGDDNGYLQSFPVEVQELAAVPQLELTSATGERRSLRLRDDFRPIVIGPAGAGDVSGEVVFGGSGADLSGLELDGRLLMVVPRGPLLEIVGRARRAGAVGVLVTTGRAELLKAEARPPDANALPMVELSQQGAATLLAGSGHTREELNALIAQGASLPSFPLAWSARLTVALRPAVTVDAHNVIAYLPAATPTTRSIVIGAHYEEIGPDPDGTVFPAANDNASGTAVLLELARRLGEEQFSPAVNIVLIGWSGHEEGLLGSARYLARALFPIADTALYIDVDTVGQGGGTSLSVNGTARDEFNAARALLAAQPEVFAIEFGDRSGGGSDDAAFSRAGVPTLALAWSGVFTGSPMIHTPADTADGVDPAKLRTAGVLTTLLTVHAAIGNE